MAQDCTIKVDAADLLLKLYENFSFFKKRRRGYQFINQLELIQFFVMLNFAKEVVLVIMNCKKAFVGIPKLIILKRDDFSTYLMGIANDIAIIEFPDIKAAEDWAFSIPAEADMEYIIFNNGIPHRNEKGMINGKGEKL